jgi:hypothetical protein
LAARVRSTRSEKRPNIKGHYSGIEEKPGSELGKKYKK